jgi:hypothetical protein
MVMTRARLDELAVRIADALEGDGPELVELVEHVENQVGIVWPPSDDGRQDPPVVLARRFARAYAAALRGRHGGRGRSGSHVAVGVR